VKSKKLKDVATLVRNSTPFHELYMENDQLPKTGSG
jgi:hypothetical protein